MPEDRPLIRVDAHDPHRCQATVTHGQCPFRAIDDTPYCPMHSGQSQSSISLEDQKKRNYRLTKWKNRLHEFADNDQIKSLREEIGVLRIVLEETMNKCETSNDIIMYSSRITDTVLKIDKVVASCHRLELSTGVLLDKSAVVQLAGNVVEIIERHVKDKELVNAIAEEILVSIAQTKIIKEDS